MTQKERHEMKGLGIEQIIWMGDMVRNAISRNAKRQVTKKTSAYADHVFMHIQCMLYKQTYKQYILPNSQYETFPSSVALDLN